MRTRVLSSVTRRSASISSASSMTSFHRPTNHGRTPSAIGSIHVMVETHCEVVREDEDEHEQGHSSHCAGARHCHLPHLHEPAQAVAANPIRVRFPSLAEMDEEEEDQDEDEKAEDEAKKFTRTQRNDSLTPESTWTAPTGWDSPPPLAAIGSPLVVPRNGAEVDSIPLGFMPLRRVESDLDLEDGRPSRDLGSR